MKNTDIPQLADALVKSETASFWLVLSYLGVTLTAFADVYTPAGFSHGMLYPPLIVLAMLTNKLKHVIAIAVFSIVFIVFGGAITLRSTISLFTLQQIVLFNRVTAIVIVIVVSALVLGLMIYVRSLSQRQAQLSSTRDSLKLSQRLLRISSEALEFGGWLVDLETKIITWSDEVAHMHGMNPGYSPTVDEAIEFYAPEYREAIRKVFENCAENGTSFDEEMEIIRADGRRIWIRAIGRAFKDKQGNITEVNGAFGEISARKKLEIERDRSLRQSRLLLDNAAQGIYGVDLEGNCQFINKAALNALGYEEAELLGRNMHDMVHYKKTSGEPFPRLECPTYNAMLERRTVRESTDLFFRKDKTSFPIEYVFSPIIDNGELVGGVILFSDITERIAMQNFMLKSQRMKTVGELSGGIAHDFNNLLTGILGYAELIADKVATDPKLQAFTTAILESAVKASDLTRQLLSFSGLQTLSPKSVTVQSLIDNMATFLKRTIGESIDIRISHEAETTLIFLDPGQLENAILELCINARNAMPDGGSIAIETSEISIEAADQGQFSQLQPGTYALIAVTDSGHGIDKDSIEHVFEPYFTANPGYESAGMGLSTVYGFITQSMGGISLYSEKGKGTVVKLYLPIQEQETISDEVMPRSEIPRGSETILVVDDNDLVRDYTSEIIDRLGYRVISVKNGAEALQIIEQRNDIDLLLTDVIMPGGMNGQELTQAARAIKPKLKYCYISGFTGNVFDKELKGERNQKLLAKPFNRNKLAEFIRENMVEESGGEN